MAYGMGPQESRWACIFSVRWLFRDVDFRELGDASPSKWAFLWTWTFADPAVRTDPVEAARRWRLMWQDRNMRGKVCVHSFEQAPDSGFWHYHAVTPDWWDVNDMREIADHHGFGRIDVKKVPASKAEYIAKYLSKSLPDLPRGARRWACHGFKGSKASDIKVNKSVDNVTQTDLRPSGIIDGVLWVHPDKETNLVLHRADADPSSLSLHIMKITPFALKEINAQVEAGKFIGVGEYRGCAVRKQNVTDKQTLQRVERLIVEHTVEFGNSSVKIAEWLPVGASSDVKPPADKGAGVFVSILEISRQYGLKVEFIKPLTQLV